MDHRLYYPWDCNSLHHHTTSGDVDVSHFTKISSCYPTGNRNLQFQYPLSVFLAEILGNGFESAQRFLPESCTRPASFRCRYIAAGLGLELYEFSTPFGYILPLVESSAKAFRVPHKEAVASLLLDHKQKRHTDVCSFLYS